jgi:hypothetical protein
MPTTFPRSNLGKGMHALAHGLRHPQALIDTLQRGLAGLYRARVFDGSPIPAVPLAGLLDPQGWSSCRTARRATATSA